MLTPAFRCYNEGRFVVVEVVLSALCKLSEAVFDITGRQLTIYCRPYYLRLRFNEEITEGKGERAVYNLDTNTLTVFVPKFRSDEVFTQLDNPAYLLATDKQRRMVVLADAPSSAETTKELDGGGDGDLEDETEFVQAHPSLPMAASTSGVCYGFADNFSGYFTNMDEDIVHDVLDLRAPDTTPATLRHQMRCLAENRNFDEDAVLISHEDEDGEVQRLLSYKPPHVLDFEDQLKAEGVQFLCSRNRSAVGEPASGTNDLHDAFEEELAALTAQTGTMPVWEGNIGDFTSCAPPPVMDAAHSAAVEGALPVAGAALLRGERSVECVTDTSAPATSSAIQGGKIAVPLHRRDLTLTMEESTLLSQIPFSTPLIPPAASNVDALTLDLLFAHAYDEVVTEGSHCSESIWTICKLSPALSWVDPEEHPYDACVAFARRALIYPLHRHLELVERVFALVGVRLLLGKMYVIRALLTVKRILDHSEHRFVLSRLFLDPLIGYWMNNRTANERFSSLAIQLHEHATRQHSETTTVPGTSLLEAPTTRIFEPIHLLSIGLPFGSGDADETAEEL